MSGEIAKIKGFADLFPPESDAFTRMEAAAREVFSGYGYQELRTPVLERTELFARSIGEETDVVRKEMYTFPDRKGRSLTLRPEATAGVIRAYIESRGWTRESVSRVYTFGPMFRYERPQKGRMRQFHQINAEIIGADEPQADAEIILMLWSFLGRLGLRGLSLEINSLGCRSCRPAYNQALREYFTGIPAEALCEDCQRRRLSNPLRVLDCKLPGCREATAGAPQVTDHICPDCRTHFETVQGLLKNCGLDYAVNPRLVRGLDYYVRTTFEVLSGDIGAQAAVAGGGRYNGLMRDLGGPDLSAAGFACGMERLALLLPDAPAPRPDFYLAALDSGALGEIFALAQGLRAQGLTGEAAFAAGSLKSRLRQAQKNRVRTCLILGADELAAGRITIKDMDTGQQSELPLDAVADIAAAVGRAG